jgi:transaldolase
LVAEGIAVNATLVFKKEQALQCANAFKKALEASGKKVDTVISIFVSRIDRALDDILRSRGIATAKAGIYNASQIYEAIAHENIPGCRALFASTGVKGDALAGSYYVEEMLAYNSINTAPLEAIDAYIKTDAKEAKLPIETHEVNALFQNIEATGIDFEGLLQQQIDDGLEAFKVAFQEILDALKK